MIRQLDAIAIRTAQIEAVTAYYRDTLGMAVSQHGPGRVHFALGPAEIAFMAAPPGSEPDKPELILGIGNIDDAVATLRARGATVTPNDGWATLYDPEGREITLQGHDA